MGNRFFLSVAHLYFVRQSSVSYRLERARDRIRLFHELHAIASETTLRRALINAQVSPEDTTIFLATLKTVSQKLTGQGLGIPHSQARGIVDRARKQVLNHQPTDPADRDARERLLRTFDLVSRSWNLLNEIEPQGRFAWKTGKGPKKAPASPPRSPAVFGTRRRGPFRYAGVQRVTARDGYAAKLIHEGRFVRLGNYSGIHHAALACNIAVRLVRGPRAPEQNAIAPEHCPDDQAAADIERAVRKALIKNGLLAKPEDHPPRGNGQAAIR